jgi:hypothetical protein
VSSTTVQDSSESDELSDEFVDVLPIPMDVILNEKLKVLLRQYLLENNAFTIDVAFIVKDILFSQRSRLSPYSHEVEIRVIREVTNYIAGGFADILAKRVLQVAKSSFESPEFTTSLEDIDRLLEACGVGPTFSQKVKRKCDEAIDNMREVCQTLADQGALELDRVGQPSKDLNAVAETPVTSDKGIAQKRDRLLDYMAKYYPSAIDEGLKFIRARGPAMVRDAGAVYRFDLFAGFEADGQSAEVQRRSRTKSRKDQPMSVAEQFYDKMKEAAKFNPQPSNERSIQNELDVLRGLREVIGSLRYSVAKLQRGEGVNSAVRSAPDDAARKTSAVPAERAAFAVHSGLT